MAEPRRSPRGLLWRILGALAAFSLAIWGLVAFILNHDDADLKTLKKEPMAQWMPAEGKEGYSSERNTGGDWWGTMRYAEYLREIRIPGDPLGAVEEARVAAARSGWVLQTQTPGKFRATKEPYELEVMGTCWIPEGPCLHIQVSLTPPEHPVPDYVSRRWDTPTPTPTSSGGVTIIIPDFEETPTLDDFPALQ